MKKVNLDKAEGMVAAIRQFTDKGPFVTKALVLKVQSPHFVRVQPLFGAPYSVPSMLIVDLEHPDKAWKERSKVYVEVTSRGLELDDEQIRILENLDVPTVGLIEDEDHDDPDEVKTLAPGAFTMART